MENSWLKRSDDMTNDITISGKKPRKGEKMTGGTD